jgi:hypothetical protein
MTLWQNAGVDFRSDQVLSVRFRTEQSFLGLPDEPLGATDVFLMYSWTIYSAFYTLMI